MYLIKKSYDDAAPTTKAQFNDLICTIAAWIKLNSSLIDLRDFIREYKFIPKLYDTFEYLPFSNEVLCSDTNALETQLNETNIDINAQSLMNEATLLSMAISNNSSLATIACLLNHGADLNMNFKSEAYNYKINALFLAMHEDKPDIFELLLQCPIKTDHFFLFDNIPCSLLDLAIALRKFNFIPPLLKAGFSCHVAEVKQLFEVSCKETLPTLDGFDEDDKTLIRSIYIYYLGFRCFCLALFAPGMSKNLANRLAITNIFTHSWNKNTCVKNT